MVVRALSIWLLPFVLAPLAAQHQDITFTAEVSKERMLLNSTLEYHLTLRNARGEDLQPPAFADFEVLQGPSRSIGTTIVNGVATSQMTFSWMLQPRRTGELTIGPATVRAQGRTYRANSRTVSVLATDEGDLAAAPENFLRLELSTDRAYVGQQIIMDLNLYATVNPISRNMVREPDLDAFFVRPRRRYDAAPTTVIENGQEYQRRTLASMALFPIKSGRLTIDPYRMVIGAVRMRTNSSFSRRFTEQIPVASDTVYVEVSELPQPRPDDFSGGVGTYRADVNIDRDRMTADDALTLTLSVTGRGDIQRLEAPAPVDEQNWYVYDPKTVREEFLDSPSGMFARKVFEYQLIPRRGGKIAVSPALTYFDTDSLSYVTLAPKTFTVTVEGEVDAGDLPTIVEPTEEAAAEEEELALLPAGEVPRGHYYGRRPADGSWYWLLALLPLVISGGLIGYDRYRRRRENVDPAVIQRKRAGKVASARLKEAREHLEAEAPRPFYESVERAVLNYLRDRFNLGVSELGRSRLAELLTQAGADAELTDRYDRLLSCCEMALYAGQDSTAEMRATYETARDLISRTERQLK